MTAVGHAVELYFDAATERRLLAEWERIGSALGRLEARPHISLAVFRPPAAPEPIVAAVDHLAEEIGPLVVNLQSVGVFPGAEGVVFLAPAVSPPLADAHRRLHDLLGDLDRSELYRPGRWVPHCTMAMGLDPAGVGSAVAALAAGDGFGPATLAEIGLVEYYPFRALHRRELG